MSKKRADLKDCFKTGDKPSEADFSNLIESSLNIADDGIEKQEGLDQPIKITAHGDNENVLDLFDKNNKRVWRISLKSGNDNGLVISSMSKETVTPKLLINDDKTLTVFGNATINGVLKVKTPSPGIHVPIGVILPYGGETNLDLDKQGWLYCDGKQYDKSTYPELYKIIKNYYGGTNPKFNVPDLRGRFLRGVDSSNEKRDPDASGRTASSTAGGSIGNNVGSLQGCQDNSIVEFKREEDDVRHGIIPVPEGGQYSESIYTGRQKVVFTHPASFRVKKAGRETRPLNIYVNYIIKAK